MLNLTLERYGFGSLSTLGALYLESGDSREQLCFTLEDQRRRGEKVAGETSIPVGTYEILLREEGGMHQSYLRRFMDLPHHGMLWLQNVPDFKWVYLHVGNDPEDTEGCPLLGSPPNVNAEGEFSVYQSTAAYRKVYPLLADKLVAGDRVVLQVRERDE